MASQNLFQSYLQPVRSVADYEGDMQQQDMRKLQLQGAAQNNAMAVLAQRQQMQGMERNALVQAAQRAAAQRAAGDEGAYAKNLRLSGFPELIDPADKVDKAATERGKAKSENAKRDTETENNVIAMWRDMIGSAVDQQQAAQMFTAMRADPRIASTPVAQVPLELGLRSLQEKPLEQWKKEFALGATKYVEMNKPTYQQQNLGGTMQTLALPGLGGAPTVAAAAPITQDANSIASNARMAADAAAGRAVTMRGQNMTDARSRESNAAAMSKPFEVTGQDGAQMLVQQTKDGRIVPVQGFTPKGGSTKVTDAKEALALLDQADPLIKGATGSTIGAGVDAAAKFFGVATPGSISAQQLKAIEGALVSKMPKMSGPQSDKDVMLYKQMAAEIGDPTVPYQRKAAAMDTVRQIQERYAGMAPGSSKPAPKAAGPFNDSEKEKRYQEWKRQQGQ